MKSVDPNHFTSFRMTIAGDPTASPTSCAYDFRGLARSCDIMEPEAYGRHGAWENVQRGRFTVDYARCVAPGRPVMWAEFGLAPYGPDALDASLQAQEATADHYRLSTAWPASRLRRHDLLVVSGATASGRSDYGSSRRRAGARSVA